MVSKRWFEFCGGAKLPLCNLNSTSVVSGNSNHGLSQRVGGGEPEGVRKHLLSKKVFL